MPADYKVYESFFDWPYYIYLKFYSVASVRHH